jgi:hypothetical protein
MISFGQLKRLLRITGRYTTSLLRRIIPTPVKNVFRWLIRLMDRKVIRNHQGLLLEIIDSEQPEHNEIIIFPPSLDWNVQLFQRPQQLALALGRQGCVIFYMQPKPDRNQPAFQRIESGVYLCNVHVDTFQVISNPIIYLLTWNSDYVKCFDNPRIIYDFVDDIKVFYGDTNRIAKGHDFLLNNAELVLATASKLVEEARVKRADVIYSPNGVVYDHFSRAARREYSSPPEDLLPIMEDHQPIIGYYGALAKWFDYELLQRVAIRKPEYHFLLIGPDYDGTLHPSRILNLPNIHWLGVKPYNVLPHYLQYFDVAMIPFVVNDITHATSPLKLFEYMAAEKPVVITPMRESMKFPGVFIADTPGEFVSQIDQGLDRRTDQRLLEILRSTALENTWDLRAKQIILALHKNLSYE